MKTVVITGASRGIGKETALRFAAEKVHMVITCRTESKLLNAVRQDVIRNGSDCICYTGDLSRPDNVKELFELTRNAYGDADVLINNAGISHIGLLHDMTDDEWNNVINTNISSVFYCCREAIPAMIRKKSGCIINISSIWGEYGASCEVAYSASKGALNAFTKALAKELAPSNIPVNAVSCGIIDTDMNSVFTSEEKKEMISDIPAGRFGTPHEIARLIYSLSTQSPYLTGQIITACGGLI